MGLKFRKSIKILPGVKLNFSSSGVSTTVGTRGLSMNFNKKGTYLNMGIPGTGIYDRKKISSNNYTDNNDDVKISNNSVQENKSISNNMGFFRIILLYIQRFLVFIFGFSFFVFIFNGDIGGAIFTLFLIILVDYHDFKLIKNKVLSFGRIDNKSLVEDITNNSNNLEYYDIRSDDLNYSYNEREYDSSDGWNILKCENGEDLNPQRDIEFYNKVELEKQRIYDEYGKLSVEFEEIKQFGDINKMLDFENKIHICFGDNIIPNAFKLELIENIDPIKEKISYDYNTHLNYYEYLGKIIKKDKFEELKQGFDLKLKYNKQSFSEYLYDLYAKSLRRIGNYYKQNKLWKESLNIFSIIEDMGQAGIMDKKSIIKITKELGK